MEVMVLQNDIRWLDVDANLAGYGDILEDACKAGGNWPDVVVLPEMFATGFCMEPEKCAPSAGAVVEWMKEAASKYDTAIAGTMAVETPDGYRNRFCFVRPDGIVTHYDKRHLFTFAGEDRSYVCGNRRVIVRWRGFDVLLQTCYDLRFPVFSRSRGDYHLALYCASWPVPR
ncbi:MAG: nitrilase family protein, partial [Alistipes sp.]|nr:nitrilase family protein [Alistipes sp.]